MFTRLFLRSTHQDGFRGLICWSLEQKSRNTASKDIPTVRSMKLQSPALGFRRLILLLLVSMLSYSLHSRSIYQSARCNGHPQSTSPTKYESYSNIRLSSGISQQSECMGRHEATTTPATRHRALRALGPTLLVVQQHTPTPRLQVQ